MKNDAYWSRVLNKRNRQDAEPSPIHTDPLSQIQALVYIQVPCTMKRKTPTSYLACREDLFLTGFMRGTEWTEQKCLQRAPSLKSGGVCRSHVNRPPVATDSAPRFDVQVRCEENNTLNTWRRFLGWEKSKCTGKILAPSYSKPRLHV